MTRALSCLAVAITLSGCDPTPTAARPAPHERLVHAPAAALRRFIGSYELQCGDVRRILHVVSVAPDGRLTCGAEELSGEALRAEDGRLTTTGALSVALRPGPGATSDGEAWSVEARLTDHAEGGGVLVEGEVVITSEARPLDRRVRPLGGARLEGR